jgi:hypothetical protein
MVEEFSESDTSATKEFYLDISMILLQLTPSANP